MKFSNLSLWLICACIPSHVLVKMSAFVLARTHPSSCLSPHAPCVWLHVVPEALASYLACYSDSGLNLFQNIMIGVCICMLWLVLWQICKGGCVTMWCPVFLQTEEVGVSALTESWTCFRPYTDHISLTIHTHQTTLTCTQYMPFIQPCAPDT